MGYTISIGELVVEKDVHALQDDVGLSFDARAERHEAAPAFGEPTDYTNSRWPSYSNWADFSRDAGLDYALYWGDELVGGHPGVRLVTLSLCNAVEQALDDFKIAHPTAQPKLNSKWADATLARLVWLNYWCRWALDNCQTPVMVNS